MAAATGGPDTAGSGAVGGDGEAGSGGEGGSSAPCTDCCPQDPDKELAGQCGCGSSDEDTDADATADCNDACPEDPDKVGPGACGCGVPDGDTSGAVGCVALGAALIHRYSFLGTGTIVTDSAGEAHGAVVNTSLSGVGTVILTGGTSDQYVDLPNGLMVGRKDVTFEAWLIWNGGSDWQRIFDFGATSGGEGTQGSPTSYLMLTPRAAAPMAALSAGFLNQTVGSPRIRIDANSPLPTGVMSHVALVFNDTNNVVSLISNGALVGTSPPFYGTLSAVSDTNNWLGRSQFLGNEELNAVFHEFRIYDGALSAEQLQLSFTLGPDAKLQR